MYYVCIFDEVRYECMYCMLVHATRINAYSCKGVRICTCRHIPCTQVLCDCVHMYVVNICSSVSACMCVCPPHCLLLHPERDHLKRGLLS